MFGFILTVWYIRACCTLVCTVQEVVQRAVRAPHDADPTAHRHRIQVQWVAVSNRRPVLHDGCSTDINKCHNISLNWLQYQLPWGKQKHWSQRCYRNWWNNFLWLGKDQQDITVCCVKHLTSDESIAIYRNITKKQFVTVQYIHMLQSLHVCTVDIESVYVTVYGNT